MKVSSAIGAVGDTLNLVGAIILILNEIGRAEDYVVAQEEAKVLGEMADVYMESEDGSRLSNFADLVLRILRKEKRRALFGLLFIVGGFVLQLVSRLVE
jgi:hypothetical protein